MDARKLGDEAKDRASAIYSADKGMYLHDKDAARAMAISGAVVEGLAKIMKPEPCDHAGCMYQRYTHQNERSAFGMMVCSRCGYEDEWQYDF